MPLVVENEGALTPDSREGGVAEVTPPGRGTYSEGKGVHSRREILVEEEEGGLLGPGMGGFNSVAPGQELALDNGVDADFDDFMPALVTPTFSERVIMSTKLHQGSKPATVRDFPVGSRTASGSGVLGEGNPSGKARVTREITNPQGAEAAVVRAPSWSKSTTVPTSERSLATEVDSVPGIVAGGVSKEPARLGTASSAAAALLETAPPLSSKVSISASPPLSTGKTPAKRRLWSPVSIGRRLSPLTSPKGGMLWKSPASSPEVVDPAGSSTAAASSAQVIPAATGGPTRAGAGAGAEAAIAPTVEDSSPQALGIKSSPVKRGGWLSSAPHSMVRRRSQGDSKSRPSGTTTPPQAGTGSGLGVVARAIAGGGKQSSVPSRMSPRSHSRPVHGGRGVVGSKKLWDMENGEDSAAARYAAARSVFSGGGKVTKSASARMWESSSES
ncbi:unnamed protein product [Discosporangium mesarthrocarpum]